MKKTALVIVLALSAAVLFAQRAAPEPVTIAGRLALANGHIVVQSGDDVYYVMGLQRLIGFVDGLREGAQISLEGRVRDLQRTEGKIMAASKLTIAGRTYDLVPANAPRFSGNPSDRQSPNNRPRAMSKPGWNRAAPSCCCNNKSGGWSNYSHDRNRPGDRPNPARAPNRAR